jgi:hypothetical protein
MTRRQIGCCFRRVWSLLSAAELPKSRAVLALAYLAAKAAWTLADYHRNIEKRQTCFSVLVPTFRGAFQGAENGSPPSPDGPWWPEMAVILFLRLHPPSSISIPYSRALNNLLTLFLPPPMQQLLGQQVPPNVFYFPLQNRPSLSSSSLLPSPP